MAENYFTELNKVSVAGKVEEKNGLKYLSWAYAWEVVKQHHPDATYTIYENTLPNGYVVNYFTDGKTAWVKTGLTINGIEHIEELPVMDNRNKSIMVDAMTSFDVNKTIQRSLTKAAARHGVGLALYSGEDLPEETAKDTEKARKEKIEAIKRSSSATAPASTEAPTTAGSVAPATAVESEELAELKKAIGQCAKKIRTAYGNLDRYTEVVKTVTKIDNFRCNVAEEKHIPLLKEILTQLKSDPKID